MIKRLRAKFLVIIMALLTVLLLTVLVIICQATWFGMEQESSNTLRSATFEPWSPGGKENEVNANGPCFALGTDHFGSFYARGHAYYDLTDKALLQEILREAQATDKTEGILRERNLKFIKTEMWKMEEYVFTDISSQMQTMNNLLLVCGLIFLVALVLFFGISWWLSGRMVGPVETAWQQQRQFVADASHELKTPLTVILTNAELLQSGEHDATANARFANSIYIMAGQMRSLVENLLDLARVDNHQLQLQLEAVDFSDLVENCGLSFEPVYFEAGRELVSRVQPGLCVRGSDRHLRQVVDILLDNGCKYATQGTQVELMLQLSRGQCLLQVRSRGEMLTPRQCKDVFKRFYRADEARSRNGSYGLGLSIAQGIVREHRGKIWAQSKDGCNIFSVSLPLSGQEK